MAYPAVLVSRVAAEDAAVIILVLPGLEVTEAVA
jgi:hypothetical protein